MGCVQSHENKHRINQPTNHKNNRKQQTRRSSTGSNPPILTSNHINGGSKVTKKQSTSYPTDEGNEKEKSSGGIEDVQFRRQSFDRNSVLRQSKKRTRKNSTASVTANGSVTTSPRNVKLPSETKDVNVVSVGNTAPLEASLDPSQPLRKTNEQTLVSLQTNNQLKPQSSNNDLTEARIAPYLTSPQKSLESSEPPQRGDFSASANVAALLGIKAQVTSEEIGQSPLPAFSTSEDQWPQPATTQLLPQSNTTKSTNSRRESATALTTFEAIQSRSSNSNGFSVMSASEVESRDMIKKSTTTITTATTAAAIKSRRSSVPAASSTASTTSNGNTTASSDHRNRKNRKTSAPSNGPPAPPPRASSTGISSKPASSAMVANNVNQASTTTLRTRREAAAAAAASTEREREAHQVEEEEEDCGRLI